MALRFGGLASVTLDVAPDAQQATQHVITASCFFLGIVFGAVYGAALRTPPTGTTSTVVRFSNRQIKVKRFQTTAGMVLMSLAGSRFSSDSAPRPFP